MTHHAQLLDRLHRRDATVGVIGMGYVGLPLAVEFAHAGFHVIGLDISVERVAMLNRGESYIPDVPADRLRPIVESGHLCATTDHHDLRRAHAITICVPTPLRKTKDPDMSYVLQAIEQIVDICQEGMLIVLESTTYPGTTTELIQPRLEARGLHPGENVFIAFSPERIDPANPVYHVHNTPKVVGGVTAACTEAAAALYEPATERVVRVSSPTSAEMVKLLENTFRAVNIGLVNEIALMCDKLGIDVWEVIEAAKSKPFGFMPFYPGPGLGGHCIPIDPHYLSWKLKTLNYTARFIELASEINTSMPLHVIGKVADALNDEGKAIRGSKILVLGVAYKRDIDDVRESPALDVISLLRNKGAEILYHDPYIASVELEDRLRMDGTAYSTDLLSSMDCVVIITDHTTIDWQEVMDHSRLIVDTRNATGGRTGSARVISI